MANLVFLIVCSVLCGVIAQEATNPTPAAENPAQPAQPNEAKPQAPANPAPSEQQGPPAVAQTQATVKAPEAVPEPVPDAKNVEKDGEIKGRVPLEPPSAQAASSNTTDKPKGGSNSVCANTGLFLLGAAMLLKL